jgi:hypothetical protein
MQVKAHFAHKKGRNHLFPIWELTLSEKVSLNTDDYIGLALFSHFL